MTEKERLRFRKGDGVVIGAVILAAAALLIFFLLDARQTEGPLVLRIYVDGALIREMPLDQDDTFRIDGAYRNQVQVQGGKAAITESTCPGEDCVHSGWISQPGRSVVCLPNRVEIRVEGRPGGEEVDAVIR